MTPKSSYVLVGLFVLTLGIALITGVLWLSTGGPPKDYDFYISYMTESVSGLSIDAPVTYKGVDVGRVRDIRLNPQNPEEVRLLLVVLEGTPINAETHATLEVQGLTGVAHVNLSGGGPDSAPLLKGDDEHPVIASSPSLLVRLDDTVSKLLGNLIETSARLNELLNEQNRTHIGQTLANVEQMTGDFAAKTGQIDGILVELEAALRNVRESTDSLPALIQQMQDGASAFETMAQTFAATGQNLEQTSVDLKQTVAVTGEDLRGFTAAALPETGALVTELRTTARNLRRMSERLQNDPSTLLFGGPKPRPGPGEK